MKGLPYVPPMSADGLNGYGGNSYARSERVRGAHHSYVVEDSFHTEDAFRAAMLGAGITPPNDIIADGKLHRFSTNAKPSDTAGWYILYGDGIPAGAFGCWRADISRKWHAKIGRKLTSAEKRAHRERMAAIEHERQAEQERRWSAARQRAEDILRRSRLLTATDGHAYLRDKNLEPCDDLYVYKDHIVVPMRSADGVLHSLQFIAPNKVKKFLSGGRVAGCFFVIDKPRNVLVLTEGMANALTIWTATGHAAVCAFSKGNLTSVAKVLRVRYPQAKLILAADNDVHGEQPNGGIEAAQKAAAAVGGIVAVPDLNGEKCDFNDRYVARGAEAVRAAIEAAQAPEAPQQEAAPRSEPTPLVSPMSSPAAYPIEALGPILGPAARAIAELVQVPDALAANAVLATAALAAQAYANVETLGGPRPLSLYITTIAGSGDRKSASDRVARAPIDEHERRLLTRYREQFAEWEVAASARKLARERARTQARGRDDYDYAAALRDIKGEPEPRKPWFICRDPTAEGAMRSLAEGQYAQGIYTDEGGQFIGGHAFSDESELRTAAMLSCAWDGARLDRVRATDSEHLVLYGRRLSMHLLVQPEVATRLLANPLYSAQGFLARFLLSAPDSIAGTRHHKSVAPDPHRDSRLRRYYEAISALLARTPVENPEVGGLDPPTLALSPEARTLLTDAYNEIESAQGPGKALEPIREWASKAAEHACRIAGVLTLAADPEASHVLPETMRGALTLTEHYLGEYTRLVGVAGIPEGIRRAQLLLDWIRRDGPDALTVRQVMQYGPNRLRSTADVARAALGTLVAHGWLSYNEEGHVYTVYALALTESR